MIFLMLGKRKNRSKASKDSLPSADKKKKKKEIERRSYGDKELVMDQARKHLKDTEFHVYDDIPKLLYDSRKGKPGEKALPLTLRIFPIVASLTK